jgi:hypothetical protein
MMDPESYNLRHGPNDSGTRQAGLPTLRKYWKRVVPHRDEQRIETRLVSDLREFTRI